MNFGEEKIAIGIQEGIDGAVDMLDDACCWY